MSSTRSAPPTWPIVARERESHRIVEALRRAPFRVQLLIGPPGVGKTVLASSVTTRFPDHRPIRIVGLTELAGIPLGAFAPAFAELGVPADPDRAVPALMAEVGLDAARHLLVVDDLMRLDDVSAATVYQLVRAFGVPTLATARLGEPPPSPIARMIDEGLVDQHEIGGLSLEQVDELLERRFDAPATYADVRRLTDRTAGNPLYLRTLVERADRVGGVRRDGDRIHIDDGGPSHGLHGAMEQNLSELDPASRRLLRVIAFLQPADPVLLGRSARRDRRRTRSGRRSPRGTPVVSTP